MASEVIDLTSQDSDADQADDVVAIRQQPARQQTLEQDGIEEVMVRQITPPPRRWYNLEHLMQMGQGPQGYRPPYVRAEGAAWGDVPHIASSAETNEAVRTQRASPRIRGEHNVRPQRRRAQAARWNWRNRSVAREEPTSESDPDWDPDTNDDTEFPGFDDSNNPLDGITPQDVREIEEERRRYPLSTSYLLGLMGMHMPGRVSWWNNRQDTPQPAERFGMFSAHGRRHQPQHMHSLERDMLERVMANSMDEISGHTTPDINSLRKPATPTDTLPGYTRSVNQDQKTVCVKCNHALGVAREGCSGDQTVKSRKIYVRNCGHVYCGICVDGFRHERSTVARRCPAVKCGRHRQRGSKTRFQQVFI